MKAGRYGERERKGERQIKREREKDEEGILLPVATVLYIEQPCLMKSNESKKMMEGGKKSYQSDADKEKDSDDRFLGRLAPAMLP